MRRREEEYVCVEREIVARHVRLCVCVCVCVSSLRPQRHGAVPVALVGNAFLVLLYF
jgi:hypothetical protein